MNKKNYIFTHHIRQVLGRAGGGGGQRSIVFLKAPLGQGVYENMKFMVTGALHLGFRGG